MAFDTTEVLENPLFPKMHAPSVSESCVVLLFIVGVTFGGGFATSALTMAEDGDDWYEGLEKPDWTPPNSVFGPVWAALYLLMSFAAFLVWRRGGFMKQALPLSLYTVQLVANFSWVFIYLEARDLLAAFIELCCLWVLIIITAILFGRVRKSAAFLLAPYIAWVAFAGSLNLELWLLNKDNEDSKKSS
ncbi:translocator protein-like [Bolinopsis microptera]|uniref:translocator protein-like n=1 Tax=Bolinopsis microptera TaxID=2820187 RepID=UPI003079F76A